MGRRQEAERKKLIEAARYWAGDRQSFVEGSDAVQLLRQAGAPAGIIAEAERLAAGDDFVVWEENAEAFVLFTDDLSTQWRHVGGLAGVVRTGLDYASVLSHLEFAVDGRDHRRDLYRLVRLMERAALDVWADKRN